MKSKKKLVEPLLSQSNTNFKVSLDQLKELVDYDSHSKDLENTYLSSRILIEELHGIEALATALNTDLRLGITGDEKDFQSRMETFGENSFPPPHIKSLWELVMDNFDETINQILCAAAVVSIIIGVIREGFPQGMIEGTSILIALVIIIVVNSANNYASERQLAKMVQLCSKQEVAVFRGSTDPITVENDELVVGDLIKFAQGMKMPADCIMVEGQDVVCREAELTGEPGGKSKVVVTEENYTRGAMGTMMAKSEVISGFGKAIVVAVGRNSLAGIIQEKTQQGDQEPTLLQQKLEAIAAKIGNVGIACAVLTFFSLIIRVIVEMMSVIPCGCQNILNCEAAADCIPLSFDFDVKNRLWADVLDTFIIAVTVIVVAIPEGLPLAVTISLSYSSQKMFKMNNLVRNLASAETMGSATHVCSDKTGTLTLNQMTVMSMMTAEEAFFSEDNSDKIVRQVRNFSQQIEVSGQQALWDLLLKGIMWNTSAHLERSDESANKRQSSYVVKGNVTESAIIKFFMKAYTGEELISIQNELASEDTLNILSFTSTRKRASIVVHNKNKQNTDQEVRVYCKGAPEVLLERAKQIISKNGELKELTAEFTCGESLVQAGIAAVDDEITYFDLIERTVRNFAERAYRTILMSYRDMSMQEYQKLKSENNGFQSEKDREILEKELVIAGVFGIMDPLRDDIKDSILKCKEAGIRVIMCTGDNLDTAKAIGKDAGILTESDVKSQYTCMTGKEFREAVGGLKQMDDINNPGKKVDFVGNLRMFKEIKKSLRVLARSSPEDKLLLVTGMQQCNAIVAVTGDGTNDAPALIKADVGFSMGITGTDIAKAASDITLMDDNFSSIIVALKYGRNVYDNVRKFLQFQLTINVVALAIVFFGSVFLKDSPLNAVQMLWINLIMDTFAALALATEPPGDNILKRKPYPKNANIVTEDMWRNVFGHGIFQIILLGFVLFLGPGILSQDYQTRCFQFSQTGGKCERWNPYFATGVYHTQSSVNDWRNRNLSASDFDQVLLKDLSCEMYVQKNQEEILASGMDPNTYVCPENLRPFLPQDFQVGDKTHKMLHQTFMFQIFVFLQLFNIVNARKLEGEFNVFSDFCNNPPFILIIVLTFIVQMAMVQYGGNAVKTWPLSFNQNVFCILVGSLSLIFGFLIKLLPTAYFQWWTLDERPMDEEELRNTLSSSFKRTSSIKRQSSIKQIRS